jgi:hypothetical protein
MTRPETADNRNSRRGRGAKAFHEAMGLLRAPHRAVPLALKVISDQWAVGTARPTLYSYATTRRTTEDALRLIIRWILNAQRPDGGIAAFYSLLRGYAESYPEVTGYLIPTLYDYSQLSGEESARRAAERATSWLLSLQMPNGAFPRGLHGEAEEASVFNTGQILLGLVRAYAETRNNDILDRATAAGDWLSTIQHPDGSWCGPGAYQGEAHSYYSMVAWALAELSAVTKSARHAVAAEKNLDWVLLRFQSDGWIDGINLKGYPFFLHFIAYVIQGVLECGILRERRDAIDAAAHSAWVLLRKFEINKHLCGTYQPGFANGARFVCLTGNAQMSCVWLRLFEVRQDPRYLNAALKMNELLKERLPVRGRKGVAGGVAGSFPLWGEYQPFRYISWGGKFLVDALMLEQHAMRGYEAAQCAS